MSPTQSSPPAPRAKRDPDPHDIAEQREEVGPRYRLVRRAETGASRRHALGIEGMPMRGHATA